MSVTKYDTVRIIEGEIKGVFMKTFLSFFGAKYSSLHSKTDELV